MGETSTLSNYVYKRYVQLAIPVSIAKSASAKLITWSYRLSVRTSGFHPGKRGSIPRSSSKFCSQVRSVGNCWRSTNSYIFNFA